MSNYHVSINQDSTSQIHERVENQYSPVAGNIPDPFIARYLLDCLNNFPNKYYVYNPEYVFEFNTALVFTNLQQAIRHANDLDLPVIAHDQIEIIWSRPHYLNIYLVDRAYGGPEEGGWYYPTSEVVRSLRAPDYWSATRHLPRLMEIIHRLNKGRPSISSVLSQGRYAVRFETKPGKNSPEVIPHYE